MKRVLSLLIAGCLWLPVRAQNTGNDFTPWSGDINLYMGNLQEHLSGDNLLTGYPAAINGSYSYQKVTVGNTFGGDVQLGYFFGKGRHFGIGLGLMIVEQNTSVTMDNFHVEYRSLDYLNDTFRQLITAHGPVMETINTTNISMPVMLKYQAMFSRRVGITIDAGLLLSLGIQNNYTAGGAFDYEAIYKYAQSGTGGNLPVYDYSTTPSGTDVAYTQAAYNKNNQDGKVVQYFNGLRAQGYNVGLAVAPTQPSGRVSYNSGSLGYLLQPALSFRLSDHLSIRTGVYYMSQSLMHDVSPSYKLTDKVGTYNSLLGGVNKSENTSYGLNVGLRIAFGKRRDTDGDGVPDSRDRCPLVAGERQYHGCPDTDGDGIPDNEDACPTAAGPVMYHGCPYKEGLHPPGYRDRDNDGVPDDEDYCPDVPGLPQFHGCPDRDGDGVPDNEDKCPDVVGPASNNGCPYYMPKDLKK